ncbi:chorismate-binding protein [Winogradskyella undariae]|uniref:chorismate-binding protein n=1 Tax=Winogradskyella undariae TaxID=1285465 RepID=UPI00211C37B4|nr:chorismate-binding protein [Winogradskyella undariae]
MMNEDSFFEALETQYSKQLPFVVYSRPINSIIKSWLQNDTTLHKTESFGESGFVFSPFNFDEQSILLPEADCKHSTLEIEHLNSENNSKNTSIVASEKEAHINLISKGIKTINKGGLKKVVLSRCESKDLQNENPFSIFKKLFNTYKNAMVYCWYHPKVGLWLGATPELLLKVEGKQLTTISLAGTQPYNPTSNVNWTPKEFEEQQIVTDYIANQIKPYSKQVNISEVETARAGNLLHLKSKITGFIDAAVNLKSIIEALHPTPAVCGFPKQEAKDFILQNENYTRGYYTGFLGELNLKQSRIRNTNRRNVENNVYAVVRKHSNFYVNLRCMQLKDSKALIYVGGGITKDSNPENEWEETVNKSRTIGAVLD